MKICPKCKGKRKYKEQFSDEQFWLAPFTLGISLIRKSKEFKILDYTWKSLNRAKMFVYTE